MIEIDWQAVEALRKLHSSLKRQDINLGFFEVKGHSRKVLKESRLTTREGFDVYRSVRAAVRQLKGGQEEKGDKEDKEEPSEFPANGRILLQSCAVAGQSRLPRFAT